MPRGLLLLASTLKMGDELSCVHFERRSDPGDVDDRNVPQAPFDAAHVRPVNPRQLRKSLLRYAAAKAQPSYSLAEAR